MGLALRSKSYVQSNIKPERKFYIRLLNTIFDLRDGNSNHGPVKGDVVDMLKLDEGTNVIASGWIQSIRRHKNVTFLQIHDRVSEFGLQIVAPPEICNEYVI